MTENNHLAQKNFKKWIPWLPDDSYLVAIAKVIRIPVQILRLLFWWSGGNLIPVQYGEKPRTEEKLKCIVMSHGMGGTRFLYSKICYDLASSGFLVVAIEHRDLSASTTYYYASEDHAKRDFKTSIDFQHIPLGENHYEDRNSQINIRSKECSKVVDFLVDLNSGATPYNVLDDVPTNREVSCKLRDFVGKLDLESLIIMGHSFGGATALDTISKTKEFKPMDVSIKNEKLEEKVQQPILFINTQTFHIDSNVRAMSKYLTTKDRKMYTILHTTHESQSDSGLMIGYWLNLFMKKINPEVALKINHALIMSFVHEHMKFPPDVLEYKNFLEEQSKNVDCGLTKPWA